MKRIKKIVLILIIILLSGCSVEYNLTINEDSSVNEKVVASENTNRMKINTGLSEDQSVNYLYKMFDRTGLDTKISTVQKNGVTISTVTGSYNSLDKYSKNFTSDLFKEASVKKDGNIITLTFDQSMMLSSNSSRGLIYDNVIVNITVPFKVIEHNADTYKRNTYTWNIGKDQKLKQIKIKYDKSDLINAKEIKLGNFKFNVKYSYMVIGVLLLVVGIIALIVYINNKKNNKI